jgi:hypothetical protein
VIAAFRPSTFDPHDHEEKLPTEKQNLPASVSGSFYVFGARK